MNVERTCNLALKLLKDIDWDLEDSDFGLEDCDFKLEDSLDLDATGHDSRRPGIPNLTGERLQLLDVCKHFSVYGSCVLFICFPLVDWGELWKAEWNVASDKCVSSRACHGTSLKQMFLKSFETRSQTESFGLKVLHSNLTCLIHNLLAVLQLMVSCLCDKRQKVMHVCMWHVQLMILAICLGWQNSKVTHSLSGVKRFPQLHYFLYTTSLSNILVIREPARSHVWYLISWNSYTLHRPVVPLA